MKPTTNKIEEIFNVKSKVIVIIGATGILGSRYSRLLATNGATVVIGDVDINRCLSLSQELNQLGLNTIPIQVDNMNEKSIVDFFSQIMHNTGKVDVLINNAQVKPEGFYDPFETYSVETLSDVVNGNLIGVTIACREACNIFLKQGYGTIINVASVYGVVAADQRIYADTINLYNKDAKFSSPVSYAISKAGVVHLTKYLASYFREKNIRVNCLTPGGVYDQHDELFFQQYSYRTLLGRMANVNDYDGAILFLASEASSYMTGFNIVVDGGWTSI